jgi:FkbM family methyltransferase
MKVDPELLNRHKAPPSEMTIEPGCFTNWLGIKTDASLFRNADTLQGKVFPEIPVGGDGIYGGYAEYASFLMAIEAASGRSTITAVELGAGWGPWISAIGVVCRKLGFAETKLIGVEANSGRLALMQEHMRRNSVTAKLIAGAVWKEDKILQFPNTDPKMDHGGAVTEKFLERDYRGFKSAHVEVPGYSLQNICEGEDIIDYMHWDIQGAEYEVAHSAQDFMNKRARFLFIGTHSRPIEGRLIDLFFQNGWDILHERPCQFVYDRRLPSIEGMLRTDGEIFARNPRLL